MLKAFNEKEISLIFNVFAKIKDPLVNKLVRIKKLSILKNLIEVSHTNETTQVFF
jgi:hypothetical protein